MDSKLRRKFCQVRVPLTLTVFCWWQYVIWFAFLPLTLSFYIRIIDKMNATTPIVALTAGSSSLCLYPLPCLMSANSVSSCAQMWRSLTIEGVVQRACASSCPSLSLCKWPPSIFIPLQFATYFFLFLGAKLCLLPCHFLPIHSLPVFILPHI